MKKGLISLAIVLSMVVSLFAPAIVVSAEEATGPNDPAGAVVLDFSKDSTLKINNVGEGITSQYNETEGAWEVKVVTPPDPAAAFNAQMGIHMPGDENTPIDYSKYGKIIVIAKLVGTSNVIKMKHGGGRGFAETSEGKDNIWGGADYSEIVLTMPNISEPATNNPNLGNPGLNYNSLLFQFQAGAVVAGATLYVKAVAFVEDDAAVAAFDLDTWRAEARDVSISAPTEAELGNTVDAVITATGSAFASSKITVKYDSSLLSNPQVAGLGAQGQVVTSTAGIIEIFDVGATKDENKYTITFDTEDMGDAKIDLTYAAFSTKESAATSDLFAANITTGSATVSIAGDISVTLPGDWFDGNVSTVEGEPYEFTATKWNNYDYPEVTYTMGGGEPQVATPDAEGKYTIENVTGDLVISMASVPTAKLYNLTINGDLSSIQGDNYWGDNVPEGKVQYGGGSQGSIWFTVPADKAASGLVPGYTYGDAVVTMGGEPFTDFDRVTTQDDGRVGYVIGGEKITGDLVITIPKTEILAEQFAASVDGNGAGNAALDKEVVNNGESVSITLTKDPLYNYTVTATMGGQLVELVVTENNTVYTINEVKGTVIFTVTKALINTGAGDEYITLEGTQMWLVTIGNEKLTDGRVYTYDGHQMFWSDKYQAYCYLVISNETPDVSEAKFGLVTGTATEITYTGDVNKTGKVDVNDAQFVYNMYNFEYDAFTSDATVEKFLRADLNDTKGVDVTDAQAIMGTIVPAVQG